MSQTISRRSLLSGMITTSFGIAVYSQLSVNGLSALAITRGSSSPVDAERFLPALTRLDEFIVAHMKDVGAPGMTLSIATRDGLLRASYYGLADLKAGIKVQSKTLFEIGSISKSFVAFALLQAQEEGKFDPTRPITTYLPWLQIESRYQPITGHHLLSHTSGLPGGVTLQLMGSEKPLWTGFAPGERFAYSNIGYDLLGLILEAIDRQPLAVVLRRRVLEPLGMTESAPVITDSIRPAMAVGYAPMFEDRPFPLRGRLAEASWIEVGEAAGSVASTATDMGLYLTMLLNRGKAKQRRIISEASFRTMISPVIKAPFRGEDASYGYGLWTSDIEGRTLLRHTGGMVAFSSAMHVDITSGIGAFASVNASLSGYRPNLVAKYALDLVRATVESKSLPAAPSTTTTPAMVPNAADFAGTFKSADGATLVVEASGDRLWLKTGGESLILETAGRDRFLARHPDFDLFAFEFGRDKRAVVELFHGPRWFTNERYTGPKSVDYPKEWDAFTGHYRNDSPWFGSTRIFVRKGKLLVDGSPLVALGGNMFRVGDEWSPERLSFGPVLNGRAVRLTFSGTEFRRTFTP